MAILTVDAVAPKIREMNGNLAAVARHFGVNRSTVHRFVKDRPTLLDVCAECRESFKDNAESSLYRAVLAGEAWAVCFYLKTQGKDRGYTERTELTGLDGKDLPPMAFIAVPTKEAAHERNGTVPH